MSTYFIKCDVCNKDIITQHHNVKYCPDCKKNMVKKQQAIYKKRYVEKEKAKDEEFVARFKSCNAAIAAIVIEAKKAGMNYGDYMAWKRTAERSNQ